MGTCTRLTLWMILCVFSFLLLDFFVSVPVVVWVPLNVVEINEMRVLPCLPVASCWLLYILMRRIYWLAPP